MKIEKSFQSMLATTIKHALKQKGCIKKGVNLSSLVDILKINFFD